MAERSITFSADQSIPVPESEVHLHMTLGNLFAQLGMRAAAAKEAGVEDNLEMSDFLSMWRTAVRSTDEDASAEWHRQFQASLKAGGRGK